MINSLKKLKISLLLKKDFFVFSSREEIKDKVDIMLSLGGDGTLLDTRPFVVDTNIAVLGINLGHLGFLTTVGRKEIKNLIKEIENKNYHIETRPLLKAFYKEKTTRSYWLCN
jgi:NAD+ kinase